MLKSIFRVMLVCIPVLFLFGIAVFVGTGVFRIPSFQDWIDNFDNLETQKAINRLIQLWNENYSDMVKPWTSTDSLTITASGNVFWDTIQIAADNVARFFPQLWDKIKSFFTLVGLFFALVGCYVALPFELIGWVMDAIRKSGGSLGFSALPFYLPPSL